MKKKKNVRGKYSSKRRKTFKRRKTLKRKNPLREKKAKKSFKRGKNRGGGPRRGTSEEVSIMNNHLAKELCSSLRAYGWKGLKRQLNTIFQTFQGEIGGLTHSFIFKCFFECTEKRRGEILESGLYVDYVNRPVIFTKVVDAIKSSPIDVHFGVQKLDESKVELDQMPEMIDSVSPFVGDGDELKKRYKLLDVDTTLRARWFLKVRVPKEDGKPLLIVTHQDFMKEVIILIERTSEYRHIKVIYNPTHEGDIANLSILLIRYTDTDIGFQKDIFLMRHCFACHNIKDKAESLGVLSERYNYLQEKRKKGMNWNYGELSICIQPTEHYYTAVDELKSVARKAGVTISGNNLTFACSPLFRAMFTLIKVLQVIEVQSDFFLTPVPGDPS